MSNGTLRRRSVFGGLLLILLGVYFLLSNLRPEWNLWDVFGRYWPVILILWGVAKLFDYVAARSAGAQPPRTLTIGEFFLVLMLVCVAGIYIAAEEFKEDFVVDFPWDSRYTFGEEVVQSGVPTNAKVSVYTQQGDVEVHPEDTPDIRVVVRKSSRASRERDAQYWADQVKVTIEQREGGYEIRPTFIRPGEERRTWGRARSQVVVDLEVHVPRQVALSAQTGRGDVRIAGISGPVQVDARGSVEIREVGSGVQVDVRGGDIHIAKVRGDVKVRGRGSSVEVADIAGSAAIEGAYYAPIRISNIGGVTTFVSARTNLTIGKLPGRLELSSGRLELIDVPADVNLTTRENDILFENVAGRVRIENRNGNVEVRWAQPPRNEVEIHNQRGHVELALPQNSGFDIRATSRNGEIESEFEDPGLKRTESDNFAELQGRLGTRGPQVRVENSYGTIRLRRLG